MQAITIEEAQNNLADIIEHLAPGKEVLILRDQQPVARLVFAGLSDRPPRKLGTLQGTVRWMAPDFDAPLEDFKEYMQ